MYRVCTTGTPAATSASSTSPGTTELRGLEGLVRAYDSILEARFDQVDAELVGWLRRAYDGA